MGRLHGEKIMKDFVKASHFNDGKVHMVSIKEKKVQSRIALAEGFLVAREETVVRLFNGDLPKGEALAVARVAGIQAAKNTSSIIPLCHSLPLESVKVEIEKFNKNTIRISVSASACYMTGVEMEALTAVSASLLTIWDMLKSIDSDLKIESVSLVEKTKK